MKKKFQPEDELYWRSRPLGDNRKDWNQNSKNWIEDYWGSKFHPHRDLILYAIGKCEPFESVLEIGCNAGINIARMREKFTYLKDNNLAGSDANKDAIRFAKTKLPAVNWSVESATAIPFQDNQYDVILADAVLMYVGPKEINAAMSEIGRVAKKAVVICDWWDGQSKLGVLKDYHWARNYSVLLSRLGFKVEKIKITKEFWPSDNWVKNGWVFIGKKYK